MISKETVNTLKGELEQIDGRIKASEAKIVQLKESIKSDRKSAGYLRKFLEGMNGAQPAHTTRVLAPASPQRDWPIFLSKARALLFTAAEPRKYSELCDRIEGLDNTPADRNVLQKKMTSDPRFKKSGLGVVALAEYEVPDPAREE